MKLLRSIALSGLPRVPGQPWSVGPREAIAWARGVGARCVQIDASASGVRPREMDRSARRDLAAHIRRHGLTLSGADLWIPPEHFVDPAHLDRALSAVAAALEFVAEVGGLSGEVDAGAGLGLHVAVVLPPAIASDALQHLSRAALKSGCVLADFGVERWASADVLSAAGPDASIGRGVDPGAILQAAGQTNVDVPALVAGWPQPPVAARLSDATVFGRVPVGEGRLDASAYEAVLVTRGFGGALVVDARGVRDPDAAARAGIAD